MLFLQALIIVFLINLYFSFFEKESFKPIFFTPSVFIAIGFYALFLLHETKLSFIFFFFLGGVLAFIPFIWVIKFHGSKRNNILAVIGIFSSTLIVFDIVDNYLFFRDKERSGFINPEIVQHDTPCSNDALIYISKKGNDWYYRCPTKIGDGLFIVIGNLLGSPLIPWPNYYSGKSKMIKSALISRL